MTLYIMRGIAIISSVLLFVPLFVSAATLRVVPQSVTIDSGRITNMTVFVDSLDKTINAVSGTISFAPDVFEVVSLSTNNSIISFWAQEPYFSNSEGKIYFEGVVLNPGFQGNDGAVVSALFRAKSPGNSNIEFDAATILANDGLGTPVLEGVQGGVYSSTQNINNSTQKPEEVIITRDDEQFAIISISHPNESEWYNSEQTILSWDLPVDTTSIRLVVNENKNSPLTKVYTPAISEYISSISEGIIYAKVQAYINDTWTPVATRELKTDRTVPTDLIVEEILRADETDPRARFSISANDAVSGIEYYAISIDGNQNEKWVDDGTGIYSVPPFEPGVHTLSVAATDRAGNSLVKEVSFMIDPIKTPVITSIEKQNKVIIINGTALPNAQVVVSLAGTRGERIERTVAASDEGFFAARLFADRPGFYILSALASDVRGAQSIRSEPETISIGNFFELVIETVRNALSVFIPSVVIIIFFALAILYGVRNIKRLRATLLAEERDIVDAVRDSFEMLKNDVTGLKVTRSSEKEKKDLLKKLEQAEKTILKETRDVHEITSGKSK